jgi:NAD(P)H-dependent flavin oxidoreductase YrpB (nitropropane dioxygenase family)
MTFEMALNTPICERLGIKYPIFQAGMGFVAHAELAAAVSNAGGLGCIRSSSMSARELKEQILRCRDLTDRPFGDILFAERKADEADSTAARYSSNGAGPHAVRARRAHRFD